MDGTFKSSFGIFFQIYTLHGLCGDNSLPFLMCLLPDKQENTFNRLFSAIKKLQPDQSDNQYRLQASINKSSKLKLHWRTDLGLLLSLLTSCLEKSSATRLIGTIYQRRWLRPEDAFFPALAFVPLLEVIRYFETLEQSFTEESERSFIDYFEETWIGRVRIRNMPCEVARSMHLPRETFWSVWITSCLGRQMVAKAITILFTELCLAVTRLFSSFSKR